MSLLNQGQPTCQLILTVTNNNLAASKFCRLSIGGLENPTLLFERNSDSFRHYVDSVNVIMGSTRISESNSISGGAFTGDSMTFTNTGIHERNAILYNFSYDQDLNSGDYVELKCHSLRETTFIKDSLWTK